MLCPQERSLFLDALRPPVADDDEDAYQLDFAVGTTFSLDLMALLVAPVAAAFADWQGRDGRPVKDPLVLLKGVRQYADRICLFCQAGKIYVPKSYKSLLVDLEDSVVEVRAPRGGSFHAKIWVMRFVRKADANDIRYRFLCLSRNTTFDRSWDTMLQLEGDFQAHRKLAIKRSRPLGDFVQALPGLAMRPMGTAMQEQVVRMGNELSRVEWDDPPEGFEEMNFVPIGIDGYGKWPFPSQMNRLLVVSPFVDDGCLADLADSADNLQLISRPESLATLSPHSLEPFGNVWVLDDTAETEPDDDEEPTDGGADQLVPATSTEIPLVGLHAKLFVADMGWNASLWTGSANATKAAFERNVEFLVELQGKKSRCGVDAVLGVAAPEGPRRAQTLIDLLQPYRPDAQFDAVVLAESKFERDVDRLAIALAAADPIAECECTESAEQCSIRLRPCESKPILVPSGWRLRTWPISLSEASGQAIDVAASVWCHFEGLSIDAVTSFFAFEVTNPAMPNPRAFVLNVRLQGAPSDRRERMLRALLANRDGVLRFLLLLLLDEGARQFGMPDMDLSGDQSPSKPWKVFESSLFESLVRALDRDPDRIDQVAQVVQDLRQTPEGQALLPEGFDSLWEPLMTVRIRQRERLVVQQGEASPMQSASETPPTS